MALDRFGAGLRTGIARNGLGEARGILPIGLGFSQ